MPPDPRPMLVLVSVSVPKGFGVPNRAVSETVVWIAVGTHAVCASSPGGCSCCIGLSNMCVACLLGVAHACPAVLPSAHAIEAYASASFRSAPRSADETSSVGEGMRGDVP